VVQQASAGQADTAGRPKATALPQPMASVQTTALADSTEPPTSAPAFPVIGDHRVRNAERPRTGPEPRRTRWLLLGIVVTAVTGISAAAWYFFSTRFEITPDATQVRVSKKRTVPNKLGPAPSALASPVRAGASPLF